MNFSIIVTAYNSKATLFDCLQSIVDSSYKNFEIILVDDASTDNSIEIAKNFPCRVVSNPKNKGKAAAKMQGLSHTKEKYVIFIDSDVMISTDALRMAKEIFSDYPDTAAIVGLPSSKNPYINFESQYKSLYMNFILSRLPRKIDFLHGCFQAINKDMVFGQGLKFNQAYHCDDIDLGLGMSERKLNIVLAKEIEIIHKKYYSFSSLLKNDFKVPYEFTQIFFRHNYFFSSLSKKRFTHTSLRQIVSVLFSLFIVINFLLLGLFKLKGLILLALLISLYLHLNKPLFIFIAKEKKFMFLLRAVLFTIIDQFVMFLGMTCGFLSLFKNGRNG